MEIDAHARPWLCATACIFGLAFSASAYQLYAAELYRWQDVNGNPAISDRPPPPGTPFVIIDDRRFGAGAQWSQSSNNSSSDNTSMTSTSQAPASVNLNANASQSRVIVNKQRALCQQAKNNISKLETFARIRVTDTDGTVRFMTNAEQSEQLATANEVVAANC